MPAQLTDRDLTLRYHIYRFFVDHGRAPTCHEIAALHALPVGDVRDSFQRLHDRHMLFLQPGTDAIRIANPFSAIPTDYRVRAGPRTWWANCAWDAFGIAAALDIDAEITAIYPDGDQTAVLAVSNGRVDDRDHVVHILLPCRRWYDDLIFT